MLQGFLRVKTEHPGIQRAQQRSCGGLRYRFFSHEAKQASSLGTWLSPGSLLVTKRLPKYLAMSWQLLCVPKISQKEQLCKAFLEISVSELLLKPLFLEEYAR